MRYLGSARTMYRVLAEAHEVRERRAQARHPSYAKPELVATAPNQVWSWDITKLKGPVPYLYYALYVILDLFSRDFRFACPRWHLYTPESRRAREILFGAQSSSSRGRHLSPR